MRAKLNGPPGTGKTTFLIKLVQTAVESGLYEPRRIGFLSFSKAGAEEARDRVAKCYKGSGTEFPWFKTIHSACYRLLDIPRNQLLTPTWLKRFVQESKIELTIDTTDNDDDDEVFSYQKIKTPGDLAKTIYSYSLLTETPWQEAIWQFEDGYNIPVDYDTVEDFVKKYESFKNPRIPTPEHPHLYDYNDMLLWVLRENMCPPLDLLIVDEVQDLSPLMFRVLNMWAERIETVVIAGDPYQAIFEFQGAAPVLMMEWRADWEKTLDQSFRCPSQIHSAARKIVGRMSQRYSNDNFSPRIQGGFVKSGCYMPSLKTLCNNSVFFLARENFRVNQIKSKIEERGIPYTYTRGRKSPVMTKYAEAISSLEKLRAGNKISYLEMDNLIDFVPQKENLERGGKTAIRQMRPNLSDFGREDKQISLENLPAWRWTDKGINKIKTGDIYGKLSDVKEGQIKYILSVLKNNGFEAIGRKPNLSIGTLHSVKGKEADTVIIDPVFCKTVGIGYEDNPEPEHRLAYVGITRARNGVYILPSDGEFYYVYPCGVLPDYPSCGEPLDRDKAIQEILFGDRPKVYAGVGAGLNTKDGEWDFDEYDMPF